MDNIIRTVFEGPTKISPVPYHEQATPRVPNDNDLSRKRDGAIAPPHNRYQGESWNDWPSYCTTLPPSPKDSLNLANGDPACSTCTPGWNPPERPFKRDTCYMLYSPQQNMWGPVCGDAGYNANWARGGRFGADYGYEKVFRQKDWQVGSPDFIKKNPVVVANSPYFPMTDVATLSQTAPGYKSYPTGQNYAPNGQPAYIYPYSVINKESNILKDPTFAVGEQCQNGNEPIYEGFAENPIKDRTVYGVIILILILFMAYVFLQRMR